MTLCVTMAGCAAQPQQEEDFFQVRTGTLSKTVYAKGETISSRTINMVKDYDLQIESALIYEGQRVLTGDVLLQLNGQYIQKKIEDAYSRIADLNQLIYSYPDMRDTVYVRPMKAGYVKDITIRRQQSVEELMSEKDGSGSAETYLSDDYVAVEGDTTLKEIISTIDYDVSGIIPVIEHDRTLVGFLTKSSLLATMSRQFVPEHTAGERSGVIWAAAAH